MDQNATPQRSPEKLSEAEHHKLSSNFLRGAIAQSLADPVTDYVPKRESLLLKFHGVHQQDDRDLRRERAAQQLDRAYSFMLRVRASGGVLTPSQWMALDQLAHECGDGTLRLTTRQCLELHGLLKPKLQEAIHRLSEAGLTSLAACGDANRNVMCAPAPSSPDIHREVYEWSQRLARRLLPQTGAYRELWIDRKKVTAGRDEEPLYGPAYLPRKFKIGIAVPPSNDVDVFTQDLGLVAIVEAGGLAGFERPGGRRDGNGPRPTGHRSAACRRHWLLPAATNLASG